MPLERKCALITGGSRGIGRGIALKLAERGSKGAVHYYQNQSAAEATLGKIRELGSDGFVVQADVCHSEEIQRMFARVKSEFGALDILVSNALARSSRVGSSSAVGVEGAAVAVAVAAGFRDTSQEAVGTGLVENG
jgi:NAD(P)-dependent dehydrogenase (short-subunit alcohol dehydrogenase family)